MKFNFKKITSLLASAVMLGSTAGFAVAANYPAPFIEGGTAVASVVVGAASPNGIDYAAASDIGVSLQAELAKQTATSDDSGAVSATGGDSVKIEKSGDKLNMNNALTSIRSTKLTDSEMPNLLAEETFRSKDNIEYYYDQYIELVGNINWTHFADNSYKDKEPTLGLLIPRSTIVLNYTIDFGKDVRSDVLTTGRLEDLEDREIVILGETYKLLNAYNESSSTKFELMRGTITDSINWNEEKTETIGEKTYTVTLIFVDENEAQFSVIDSEGNSQPTPKLTKGGTYKLSDGTQLGVTDLSYQGLAGGVMSAEFTLGADKITIENGQLLEINDEDVEEVLCAITKTGAGSSKEDIGAIKLQWKTSDEEFVTAEETTLIFPGFESIKLIATEMTFPSKEVIKVEPTGSYGVQMTIPIKDGDAKVDILYGNSTTFTDIGGDAADDILRTAVDNSDSIIFDRDTDDYFFATWNSSSDHESYLLSVSSIGQGTSSNSYENKTTIKKIWWDEAGVKQEAAAGSDKKVGDTFTIGSVELTLRGSDYNDKWVNLTINSGGSFNRVYTKGGLQIWLPWNATNKDAALRYGAFNGTFDYQETWNLILKEEDKEGTLGTGDEFNVTIGHSSSKSDITEVYTQPFAAGGITGYKEIGDTEEYEGYVESDLATRILFKKPSGSQNSIEITYHGKEAYANVFITAPEVTLSATGGGAGVTELGSVIYYDNELTATAKSKNLIVVGGSCVNTVAAELLGGKLCTADFTAKTGVGANQFLIEVFDNPYATGKKAMLVAGYEAGDTAKAVTYVTKEAPATDVGTKLKKVTATYADVA